MKYDLEIVIPVTSRYKERLEDFKKYGLINVAERKILVTLLMSAENIDGLEEGWGSGIVAKSIGLEGGDYVSNLYGYFLNREPESRWIMKLDDDSCTDIEGLLSNMDRLYSSDEKTYVATSLASFEHVAIGGRENELAHLYEKTFGRFFAKYQHEIEMSAVSHVGLKHIQSCEASRNFLEERCRQTGGATDVALPYSSILAKMPPVNFPFSSHFPLINQFSIFGGHLNHIHLVSRAREGDNFPEHERCGELQYEALARAISGEMNDIEKSISGKKFVMESEHELRLYAFYPNRTARVKFDQETYIWLESQGKIHMFCESKDIRASLTPNDDGSLKGFFYDQELILKPIS